MAYKKEHRQAFINALRKNGGIITYACNSVGIHYTTYQEWRKKYKDFDEECDHVIIEESGDFVESALMNRIKAGDTTAIIFYCKTKLKSRGFTERTEITGADGEPLVKARILSKDEAMEYIANLENDV